MKTIGVYGMAGFSKVFSTIWGGSLHGHFEASAVFLVFLSLADREGTVDMTPQAIAGTTGWPLDFILKGIEELEAPDPKSRTEGHEGRRILPLDSHRSWGWIITNYSLYRDKMRSADRTAYLAEKQREYRARKSTTVNKSTNINQDKPIADADADAYAYKNKSRANALPVWLDKGAWESWRAYRAELRKPLKPSTISRQLKFLSEHQGSHSAIIEQSIRQGWTGLFPLGDSRGPSKKLSASERVRLATEKQAEDERKLIP